MNYGRITLSRQQLIDDPQIFLKAFTQIKFLPLVIRDSDTFGDVDYFGYSPLFQEIQPGEVAPKYNLIGQVSVQNGTEFHIEPVSP